jgi:hypothetical protein
MAEMVEAGEIPASWLGDYEPPLPGSRDLFEAFWELSTDRDVGFGYGEIPASAIDRYARRHGFDDPDEFEMLRRAIRAMDREYLKHKAEQMKAQD